ncbi:hypothetical protein [Streptomyces viridochromogenes]|uniref:Putative Melibiase n=1 Tax=Streptomyces viridochromogenes Tue57 TaxID=1160705 RepID=L8P311_STRVR|nr:hypothetical protein [Streptomyces viridochromogenes]ELS50549.1 putative Melibiase [Streptomyces viridochromogenes Tue57]
MTSRNGRKVGNLYLGGTLRFNDIVVDKAGTYLIKVAYVSGTGYAPDIDRIDVPRSS